MLRLCLSSSSPNISLSVPFWCVLAEIQGGNQGGSAVLNAKLDREIESKHAGVASATEFPFFYLSLFLLQPLPNNLQYSSELNTLAPERDTTLSSHRRVVGAAAHKSPLERLHSGRHPSAPKAILTRLRPVHRNDIWPRIPQ